MLSQDSVAIIGIGCRFPGGIVDAGSFWNFVKNSQNGITRIPNERWNQSRFYRKIPASKGKLYVDKGGFLDGIDSFDPAFFGISAKEASHMDPQQRILLEVTWEALEDAGILPTTLSDSDTGVYIGSFVHDYENIHSGFTERNQHGVYSAVGVSSSILANRISHCFNFKGPSLVVDTACSSSLVGIHLACNDLLHNNTSIGIAGGINLMLKPEMTMILCNASMLSPDGYCKTFDQAANGYVRAEGVGVVVLKRLNEAIKDNDPIYCVIKGTATNQDGTTPTLTTPDGNSQIQLIKDTLARSGCKSNEIQYVEAHGTGTEVGDPIEANAIGKSIAKDSPYEEPCFVGSVKSNFGHTESAAGVAGVIKTALMLTHQQIPPNLHFDTPNPKIDFKRLRIKVPTSLTKWKKPDSNLRKAGVNSFGFGGTNAHAILEEYISIDRQRENSDNHQKCIDYLIPISAKSHSSLVNQLRSWNSYLAENASKPPQFLNDIALSAAIRKSHHPFREIIQTKTLKEAQIELDKTIQEVADKKPLNHRKVTSKEPNVAFVFSGMGQQWPGMGKQLYKQFPEAKRIIDVCDNAFLKLTRKWSLLEQLTDPRKAHSRIHETQIAQPCIFAIQLALAEVWKHWGIKPQKVIGHSVGEIAASVVAGIFPVEVACHLVFQRSRLQHKLSGLGGMLALGISVKDYLQFKDSTYPTISIAAVNGPQSITLAGKKNELEALARRCEEDGIFNRILNVDVPYHSAFMDAILAEFKECINTLKPGNEITEFVSTVTGESEPGNSLNEDYWCRNVRQPVQFQQAIASATKNIQVFIEIGAHPVLKMPIAECVKGISPRPIILPSSQRGSNAVEVMKNSVAISFKSGLEINWGNFYQNHTYKFVRLPRYTWDYQQYWNESRQSLDERIGNPSVSFLGKRCESPATAWIKSLNLEEKSIFFHHCINNDVVFPLAGHLQLAILASLNKKETNLVLLKNLKVETPLALQKDVPIEFHTSLTADGSIHIHSRKQNQTDKWSHHFEGQICFDSLELNDNGYRSEVHSPLKARVLSSNQIYETLGVVGLNYGPTFRLLKKAWVRNDSVFGEITQDRLFKKIADPHLHQLVLLDSCFQLAALITGNSLFLPDSIGSLTINTSSLTVSVFVILKTKTTDYLVCDIFGYDQGNRLVCRVKDIAFNRYVQSQFDDKSTIADILYKDDWYHTNSERNPAKHVEYKPDVSTIQDRIQILEKTNTQYSRERYHSDITPRLDKLAAAYWIKSLQTLSTHKAHQNLEYTGEKSVTGLNHSQQYIHITNLIKGPKHKPIYNSHETNPEKLISEFTTHNPEFHIEASLIRAIGTHLVDFWKGIKNPVDVIFQDYSELIGQFYSYSQSFSFFNQLLRDILDSVIKNKDQLDRLKILEIGAGTGGLTTFLTQIIDRNDIEFLFSDVSPAFIENAKLKFRSFQKLGYKLLDIEKPISEQGYTKSSFDIIVASSVLHATNDLNHTLHQIKTLLKPGGLFIFNEVVNSPLWVDMVFGMFKDWWGFNDFRLHQNHPLISKEKWKELLLNHGFINIEQFHDSAPDPINTITTGTKKCINPSQNDDSLRSLKNLIEKCDEKQCYLIITNNPEFATSLSGQLMSLEFPTEILVIDNLIQKSRRFESENLISLKLNEIIEQQLFPSQAKVNFVCINDYTIDHKTSSLSPVLTNVESCNWLLNLTKTVTKQDWKNDPRIWNITYRSQEISHDDTEINCFHSATWGARRVIANEFPNLDSYSIDIDSFHCNETLTLLCQDLTSSSNPSSEIAYRKGKRLENHLTPIRHFGLANSKDIDVRIGSPFFAKGQSFRLTESIRCAPGDHEVEVEVKAVALNFKDIAKTYHLHKPDYTNPQYTTLGMECSGIVTRTGKLVSYFKPGDRIYGTGWDCMAKFATLNNQFIQKIPAGMSYSDSVTIPLAYLTAHFCFRHIANIQKGDRVLIHSASGGVGLAAINIAKNAGAEIYATAGTPAKRNLLKSLGIRYVGDSRKIDFKKEIFELTNQQGVDIILSSLPEQTLDHNISLLKPHKGKLIDIGNLHEQNAFPIKALREGKSFHVVDMERLAQQQSDFYADLFQEVTNLVENQYYLVLPHQVIPIENLAEAFNSMARAQHLGKQVVSLENSDINYIPNSNTIYCEENATYLIAGGTRGFGFATAKWLAQCGAKNLILVSRSGIIAEECMAEYQDLISKGLKITIDTLDISNDRMVKEYFEDINDTHPPLKGIIHSAMHLDVALIDETDSEKLEFTFAPKVSGAWNLFKYTKDIKLDFYLLYSSINSKLGFAGQFAYSAANAFLDSFAAYLRKKDIPASSICWSLIDEAGYFTHHKQEKNKFKDEGYHAISLSQAWKSICYVLNTKTANLGVFPVEWHRAKRYTPVIRKSAYLSHLVLSNEQSHFNDLKKPIDSNQNQDLFNLSPEKRTSQIRNTVVKLVADTLGISNDDLKPDTSFDTFNFDSLMAVDLGVKLLDKFDVDIPKVTLLEAGLNGNNLSRLVEDELSKSMSNHVEKKILSSKPFIKKFDLHKEAILPSDIRPAAREYQFKDNPSYIFLTGVTGFLGAFLLSELMATTKAQIACLIRAENKQEALNRLKDNLSQYNLWKESYFSRLDIIVGDLSQPKLGLEVDLWSHLATQLDVIYHCAAKLNFALPYARLRETNVLGTIEIIRLAAEAKNKPLHYISTLIKIAQTCADPKQLAKANTTRTFDSAYDNEYLAKNGFNIGYHQSKWVAEELVLEAEHRGIPITIYRTSLIAGESTTGVWNTNDYICQLTKGIIQMGLAPKQDLFFDFCPVDYLGKSIVHLSLQPESIGMGYILKHPNPVTWNEFIKTIANFGYDIQSIEPEKWMNCLHDLVKNNTNNPLYSLLPLFEVRPKDRLIVATPKNIRSLEIIAENTTRSVLKKADINCPNMKISLFRTYINYLKKSGFIQ